MFLITFIFGRCGGLIEGLNGNNLPLDDFDESIVVAANAGGRGVPDIFNGDNKLFALSMTPDLTDFVDVVFFWVLWISNGLRYQGVSKGFEEGPTDSCFVFSSSASFNNFTCNIFFPCVTSTTTKDVE